MHKLVLIDTANFLHRAFYAYPMVLTTSEGQVINAVYGFASMLAFLIKELNPTHLVCALESEKETVFREIEFPDYKATRVPKSPEEQAAYDSQFPLVLELLKAAGIRTLQAEGFEADDVIGTAARKTAPGTEVVVASNDRDLMQLIDGGVRFYLPAVGKGKAKFYGRKEFEEEYGFAPENLVDYKSLRGDPSDNIPGVRGIGDKTARDLIRTYGTLEQVYKHILEIRPAVAKKLADWKESAELSHRLAKISTAAPVEFTMEELKFKGLDNEEVLALFKEWNFKSLIEKIHGPPEEDTPEDKDQLKLL